MPGEKLTNFHLAVFLFLIIAGGAYFLLERAGSGLWPPAESTAGRERASIFKIQESQEKLPDISAAAALAVLVGPAEEEKILFSKASTDVLPIASVAKLMSALVAVDNFSRTDVITISQQAVSEAEDAGGFRAGEQFFADDLLRSLVIESSNDAAAAFAEVIGRKKFVATMNAKAEAIGLKNTRFTNPTGLDAGDYGEGPSRSSAEDLVKLSRFITDNNSEIFEISALASADLYDASGAFHHRMRNTNELLRDADVMATIIGGKTGETPAAGQALLVVTEGPAREGYVVSVVLNSRDRFGDMKKILFWVYPVTAKRHDAAARRHD